MSLAREPLPRPRPGPDRGPAARPAARSSGQEGFWAIYDVGTATLALLVASDALNASGLASPVWLLVYALVLARVLLVWRAFFDCAARNAVVFLFPAVCIASTLWSYDPSTTLRGGVQLAFTVLIALFIGWRFSLRHLALLFLLTAGLTVWLSLADLPLRVFGSPYDENGNFVGIYTHKNMLGQRAMFAVLAALTVLLLPHRVLSGPLRLFALVSILVLSVAIALSQAVTAILLTPLFVGLYALLCLPRLPRPLALAMVGAGTVTLAFGPLALVLLGVDPVGDGLAAVGKNATLTGRTELWAMALMVVERHGLLGVGFNAFWSAPAFAELAYYAQEIGGETVKAFHNFLLEVQVGTGVPGLVAMGLLAGLPLVHSARLYARTASPEAAFALTVVLGSIALSLLGASLYRQHEIMMVVIVMIGVSARTELRAHSAGR